MKKDSIITKLSVFSVRNFRLTILAFISIILLGSIAYTSLLPRQGFPELEFPTAFIQTIYPVQDAERVDDEITLPIISELNSFESIESADSTSSSNFSFIIISFETGTNVEEEVDKINEAILLAGLPEQVEPEVIGLKANAIDGENDLILGVVNGNNADLLKLQEVALEMTNELKTLDTVQNSNPINQFEEVFNPITNQSELTKLSFNRYGEKKNGEILTKETVLIGVQKEDQFTTTELSEEVRNKMESINDSEEFNDFEIVTIYDEAEGLDEQISSLENNALSALIIVAITLFLFVSWRASIVAVIFIPTVMAATFLTLLLIGVSLNVISLFALILVLGLLVDDAIVIVESIDYYKRNGFKGISAIKEAINDVGKADIIGTVTTLMAFFPMLFIIGFLGEIIRDVPITVIVTLIWSLFIALTIIPLFSNFIIPSRDENQKRSIIYWILNIFNEVVIFYGKITAFIVRIYTSRWYLNIIVVLFSLGLIGAGGYFASQLQFVDFPAQKDSNSIMVNFSFDNDLTIYEKEEIAIFVEDTIIENYEDLVEEIKYPQVGRDFTGSDVAIMMVELESLLTRSETSVEISEDITKKLGEIEGASVDVVSSSNGGPPSLEYQSQIQLYGNNVEDLENAANEIEEFISNIEFETEVEVVDTRISNLDLIVRNDGRRYVLIESKLEGEVDDAQVRLIADEVKSEFDGDKLDSLGLSDDAIGDDRGFASEIFESVISAGVALLGSFVLIYLFLVITFNSFSRALLIMLSIPFSFFGLFVGLNLTNNPISFFVIIGMIALVGIVVNNSVMLLDFAIQARSEGKNISESIVEAVKLRFRPLLTTSATTILGSIPLALTDPFWESLAFAIIFGLLSSTILVITAFPAYYVLFEQIRKFIKGYIFRIKEYRN